MPLTDHKSSASSSKKARKSEAPDDASQNENDNDTPKAKRQRVSRACDQCRLSREKCNGLKPSCQTCIASGRACTYATNPKKRGIQSGYIRALELSLGWLFTQDIGADQLLKRELASEGSELQRALTAKSGSDPDVLHGQWTSSIVNKQIDRLLSGDDLDGLLLSDPNEADAPSISIKPSATPSVPTPKPPMALARANSNGSVHRSTASHSYNNLTQSPLQTIKPTSEPNVVDIPATAQMLRPRHLLQGPLTASALLQLPVDFWKLIDVYYSFTHSWLPISEKNEMLKTAYTYPVEGLTIPTNRPGSGLHAELWAIVALAAHQTQGPSHVELIDKMTWNAQSLIPSGDANYEIGHVKALLILGLIHLGRRSWTQAWMSVGSAVRVALLLNLHTLALGSNPGPADQSFSRAKHIILACFVLESIVCMYLRKPAHLTPEVVSRIGMVDQDGLEEWTPWDTTTGGPDRQPARTLSIFNALVGILGRGNNIPDKSLLSSALIDTSPTPQQVHLRLVAAWHAAEDGTVSTRSLLDTGLRALDRFNRLGGTAAVPPTLVPLLERLVKTQDPAPYSQTSNQPQVLDLFDKWTVRVPLSAARSPSSLMTSLPKTYDKFTSGAHIPVESLNAANALSAMSKPSPASIFNQSGPSPMSTTSQPGRQGRAPSFNTDRAFYIANSPQSTTMSTSHLQSSTRVPTGVGPDPHLPAYADQLTPEFFSDTNQADFEAIFEEIAMLEGSRHAQDGATFMQNLGVGPDLDLSAFFGADYQASDPMLAYLQPGIVSAEVANNSNSGTNNANGTTNGNNINSNPYPAT